MKDLIDRQAAIDFFLEKGMVTAAVYVERMPPACSDEIWRAGYERGKEEAEAERKRGKWINVNEGKWNVLEVLKCSACGEIDNRMYRTDSYCPNCGADMREDNNEN